MNLLAKIFGLRKKRTKEHIEYWKDELKLAGDGYSKFQSDLALRVKSELTDLQIDFTTETSNHQSLSDKSLTVKMLTLTLQNVSDSKIWIYHDMADYDILNTHHIFEEWDYLRPEDLKESFIESLKTELKKTEHNNV